MAAVNLLSSKRKKMATREFDSLLDDCWEYVLLKLLNNENDGVDDSNHCLKTPSVVSKQLLSISNRFVYSFTLIYNPSSLTRIFQRFPNLTSLDLSGFQGVNLNTLFSQIPRSVSLNLTSLNISNHPTFPALGLQTILKKNKSILTSLICSHVGNLKYDDMTFIADSFPFLQDLDISFPKERRIGNYYNDSYNNALKVLLTQKLSKLCKVNLSGNIYVNDSLFFQLCMNCEFLQEVVMSKCPSITYAGIASAICQRLSLTSLSVANFEEPSERKNVTSCFIDSLASLTSLTCLDLSFSCITDSMLDSLAHLQFFL